MADWGIEVWDPPGIATFTKKIASLRPQNASGTRYRRQTGRGTIVMKAGYERLGDIIAVDPSNHANDVASLIRVNRGTDLIQELLVYESPNLVTDLPAVLALDGIEAVMDWAVVEAWDWDGTADFDSRVPDWIFGGRNLLPDLALGDLNSIREEWELYLSGERYTLDASSATAGTYTLTIEGDTTAAIDWDATHSQIKSAIEAVASVTEVSVVQADPEVNTFTVVFEDPKDLSANATISDSTTGGVTLTKLNDGFDPSLNPTFTITVDGQTTNALPWDATPSEIQGSPLTGNGLEGLSNIDDVEVGGSGIASDPWVITFYAPPDPTNLSVTFAAGTDVFTKTQEGSPDPSPITKSMAIDATSDPSQHGCYDDPPIEVVTTPLDTGADWSLLVNATCQFAGSQVVINNVQAGQLYQSAINVWPTVTGEYVLVIRDEFENFIAQSEPRHTELAAGSFQTLSITDIEIPDGVESVIMRVAVVDFDSSTWADFYVNWQGAIFREGQAPATVGTIMGQLLDDAQTDHASSPFARSTIDFINKTFSNTLDTGGNAWTDSELSVSIPRGMTYRKVLDRIFGEIGYEWNVTPTTGTPGEWDLNVWNPDGRGTDHTAAATPSILTGQGTTWGSATRSLPEGNIVISEGDQQYSSRTSSSASYGTIGRRERYQADVSYSRTEVDTWTDKTLARFLDVSLKPRFEIADPPDNEWPVPVVDYDLADTLNVDFGEGKISREVEAISWRYQDDAVTWGVHTGEAQFDAIGLGRAGGSGGPDVRGIPSGGGIVAPQRGLISTTGPVDEGVRRLIDVFERLRLPQRPSVSVPTKAGGMFTIAVAASNASEESKGKADFICPGTPSGDRQLLNQVIDTINLITDEGRMVLSEGQFFTDQGLNTSSGQIVGMGPRVTILTGSLSSAFTPIIEHTAQSGMVRDMSIEGTGRGIRMGGSYQAVENCYIATSGAGISTSASYLRIEGCIFEGSDVGITVASGSTLMVHHNVFSLFGSGDHAIHCTNDASYLVVTGNYSEAGGSFLLCDGALNESVIAGNVSEYSGPSGGHSLVDLSAGQVTDVRIVGNEFTGIHQAAVSAGNAGAGQSNLIIVSDNTLESVQNGVEITNARDCIVNGNYVNFEQHGLVLDNCDRVMVTNNDFLSDPPAADNTYDLIQLAGDLNMVHGNMLQPSTGANQNRFGVNVVSGDCNKVVGNDLGDLGDYGSDAIADGGTNTWWRYPDDPVYGDNFTDCAPTPS